MILKEEDVVKNLKILCESNEYASSFMKDMAARAKASSETRETTVERLQGYTEHHRPSAIALMDAFEEAGAGSRRNGRRGYKTRFEWEYPLIKMAKKVTSQPTSSEPVVISLQQLKELAAQSMGVDVASIEVRL